MGKVFVGHDWAEDHHDVFIEDDSGQRLAGGRLAEGIEGIARFHELIAGHVEDPAEVLIATETDRGLFVNTLVAAGYKVLAVNPMSTSRYRERHSTSGAKSDPGDAKVLADLARTDAHNHRLIAGDSELGEALRSEQLEAPSLIADAMGATVAALVALIGELNTQIASLEAQLADRFEQHPDAKIIRSLPGLGMTLGARVLGEFGDDPNRYEDAKSRKNYSGMSPSPKHQANTKSSSPVTPATDGSPTPATCGPSQRSPQAQAPGRSTTNTAPEATHTAEHSELSLTVSLASSTAASDTAPSTTNTPPGHTDNNKPLDTNHPWDV